MATVNLGRIKPVFRGAWTSGAYVIDDIVTHGNESFICIQAGSNIATTNASYWSKLAAKGADGTDVSGTLTTQGDILYRDGSGLQRLAAGTNGQALLTGGAGANPSWGTVESNLVKLATTTVSSNVANVNFDSSLITSTYSGYKILFLGLDKNGDNFDPCMEFSTDNGSSFISLKSGHRYQQLNGTGHGDSYDYDVFRMASDGEGDAAGASGGMAEIVVPKNNDYNDVHANSWFSIRNQNGDHYGYWATGVSTSNLSARVNYFRIKDHAGGNIQGGTIVLYAYKD
tara:strand:+ start:341 stop:1195 length:855 start_codon:yes stop_codon:yes gene_type:complete